MQPRLTADWANLARTEEAPDRYTTEVPRGHTAVVIWLAKELLASTQTAEQNRSLRLVHRIDSGVLNEQLLKFCTRALRIPDMELDHLAFLEERTHCEHAVLSIHSHEVSNEKVT